MGLVATKNPVQRNAEFLLNSDAGAQGERPLALLEFCVVALIDADAISKGGLPAPAVAERQARPPKTFRDDIYLASHKRDWSIRRVKRQFAICQLLTSWQVANYGARHDS